MNRRLLLVPLTVLGYSCGSDSSRDSATLSAILPVNLATEARLGMGIHPVTEEGYQTCVDFSVEQIAPEDGQLDPRTGNSGSPFMKIQVEELTSYLDIDRYTQASVKGSFNYLASNGKFEYGSEQKYHLTSDKIHVGIQAVADYGRYYLKDVKLKPEFANLADENLDEFYRICGHEYIAGYRLGQSVRVILSSAEVSKHQYSQLKANLEAGLRKVGSVGGKIEASFLSVAESLVELGSLLIDVNVTGGTDLKSFSNLIKPKADVHGMKDKISELIRNMDKKDATKTAYLTLPYPLGTRTKGESIFRHHQRATLESLWGDYRKLAINLRRVRDLTRVGSSQIKADFAPLCAYAESTTLSCDAYIKSLDTRRSGLEEAMSKVDKLASDCINAHLPSECKTPDYRTLNFDELVTAMYPKQFKYLLYRHALKAMIEH